MQVRIATWNINSVRARLHLIEQFVKEVKPDVLCLQEIKVVDELYPRQAFHDLGFANVEVFGQKAYHGVAIVSNGRVPLARVKRENWCEIDDARHLHCRLGGDKGVELHNFYVPAGGDVPDPEANDKFAHKLRFMTEVTDWFRRRKRKANRFMLVGDLNVAPLESDVWNHKALLKVVSHTPVEVEHMARWYQSHDWVDVVRNFIPPQENLYTWWSYRARDWAAADKGRRLDHVWATPALAPGFKDCFVYKPARGYEKASDHAPVVVDVEI
jgi:exodeoxyribonuclease-3